MSRRRLDAGLLGLALAIVVGVLVWRVAAHGVAPIAPDDAEYIGVGRQLLSFHVPHRFGGDVYTIRAWGWPLLVGAASRLHGGDVFRGPMILGVAMGAVALTGAVLFAFRRRGGLAAIVTALVLASTAAVWEVAASTRVDVALIAFFVLTLLVAAEPATSRRVILAGALAGVTLLVKESSVMLVLLPLAWIGVKSFREWRADAVRFWIAYAVAVSWWFVLVLVVRGQIFPFEGYEQAVQRQVPRAWTPNVWAWVLVAGWALAAIALVPRARRDVGTRALLIGLVALVPPAFIAWNQQFALRQFAPIAVIGAIAIGVAVADLLGPVVRRARQPDVAALGLALVLGAVAIAPITRLVRSTTTVTAGTMDRDVASWLDHHTKTDAVVAATFKLRTMIWVRDGEHNRFTGLGFATGTKPPDPMDQAWLDWSAGDFSSLSRRGLAAAIRRSDIVLLTGPHRQGPIALVTWLEANQASLGLVPAAHFLTPGVAGWSFLYRVVKPGPATLPVPRLITVAALTQLSDATVAELGPITVAGPEPAVSAGVARITSLGGGPATALVAPER